MMNGVDLNTQGVEVAVALDVVGKVARVTADITPGHLGEVLIEVRQGTERFLARASDSTLTIPRHAQVIVVGSLGGRTVEVEPTDSLRLPS
jgi:hypothetical protein